MTYFYDVLHEIYPDEMLKTNDTKMLYCSDRKKERRLSVKLLSLGMNALSLTVKTVQKKKQKKKRNYWRNKERKTVILTA